MSLIILIAVLFGSLVQLWWLVQICDDIKRIKLDIRDDRLDRAIWTRLRQPELETAELDRQLNKMAKKPEDNL